MRSIRHGSYFQDFANIGYVGEFLEYFGEIAKTSKLNFSPFQIFLRPGDNAAYILHDDLNITRYT